MEEGRLPDLRVGEKRESVVLVGQALDVANDLLEALPGAQTYTDVVYRGLALLHQAKGKQVELREPGSRQTLVVDLWA